MYTYDAEKIRKDLSVEQLFELLEEFGGNPTYNNTGFVSDTVCHNLPNEGSHKLYYYDNDDGGIFQCYTGCGEAMNVFQLVQKVFSLQRHQELSYFQAILFVAERFGYSSFVSSFGTEDNTDWKIFKRYESIREIKTIGEVMKLEPYDKTILERFNYKVKIGPWLKEHISQEVLEKARIGYFAGDEVITIPHYDIDNNFVGLRCRALVEDDAKVYGKYRPMKINGILYNHPLSLNLYGLNWAKESIKKQRRAIVVEAEKSVLQAMSYLGDSSIVVACCGSSFTEYQFKLLKNLGIAELYFAFDKDFENIGDKIFEQQKKKLTKLNEKYGSYVNVRIVFDKKNKLPPKSSPTDFGKETFINMLTHAIRL